MNRFVRGSYMIKVSGFMKHNQIIFFTPYYHQNRGNSTTAKRIVHGLRQKNITVHVFAYEEEQWSSKWTERLRAATLLHILHFRRFADWNRKHPHIHVTKKPYIITSGGTDINHDLKDKQLRQRINPMITNAAAITVFNDHSKRTLTKQYPNMTGKIFVIPQSVLLHTKRICKVPTLLKGYPRLFLPAGLRKVKDVLFLKDAIVSMRNTWPQLTFTIAGPPLDSEVVSSVKNMENAYCWFSYIGEIPHEQMPQIYKQMDLVLNSSQSEGQPLALLEAMALGKIVVARKIAGNESIITNGETGLLFEDEIEFKKLVKKLLNDPAKQRKLRENAFAYIQKEHTIECEINRYIEIYNTCIS